MENYAMTGTIYLSTNDSAFIRQNVLNPSETYLREQEDYFERLSSGISIHTEGSNSSVEFDDLDLSALDSIIQEEVMISTARTLLRCSSYISANVKISFGNMQHSLEEIIGCMSKNFSSDTPNTTYYCENKAKGKEYQGSDLAEAA